MAAEGEGTDGVVLRSVLDASVRQTVVQVRFTALSMYWRATAALVDGASVTAAATALDHAATATDRVDTLARSLREGELGVEERGRLVPLARGLDAADRTADLAELTLRSAVRHDSI
jgi:hypothetical protein